MNETEFWRIIEMTKIASAGDGEKQVELLVEHLSQLTEGEILDFDYILDQLHDQAYDRALWDAAFIINGGCSDDGFHYFKPWLIAQGQAIYLAALADPDTLADVVELGQYASLETLNYVAIEAYEIKTGLDGLEMPSHNYGKTLLLKGEWTKQEDLAAKFPKLYAKFVTNR